MIYTERTYDKSNRPNRTKRRNMIEDLCTLGLKVLVALARDGGREKYIREIIRDAGISSSAIYRALAVLLDYDLIVFEEKYGRKFVRLTREGREVAEILLRADKILREVKQRRLKEVEKEEKRGKDF